MKTSSIAIIRNIHNVSEGEGINQHIFFHDRDNTFLMFINAGLAPPRDRNDSFVMISVAKICCNLKTVLAPADLPHIMAWLLSPPNFPYILI